jgi:hypothetical protein
MLVMREITQVDDAKIDEPALACARGNAQTKRPGEKLREDSNDVDSKRTALRLNVRRCFDLSPLVIQPADRCE